MLSSLERRLTEANGPRGTTRYPEREKFEREGAVSHVRNGAGGADDPCRPDDHSLPRSNWARWVKRDCYSSGTMRRQ
jgi:hypothetical protein